MRTLIVILVVIFFNYNIYAQTPGETIIDFDGNIYNSIILGNQTWFGENLKAIHYSDGTEIPDAVTYNNDESLTEVYGRLYTWDAAMNNSNLPSSQGVCPCGWHIPTDEEWKEMEDFLGGADIAGGKLKSTGTDYWNAPNTGADNVSGMNILPGGEYDAHYNPNKFQLLNEYAVYWTSTEINSLKARERYLSYNDAKSSIYDWYKTMKYSIRCVKDEITTAVDEVNSLQGSFKLGQNYPNPFNPTTTIEYYLPYNEDINISIFNILGNKVADLISGPQQAGMHSISFSGEDIAAGIYFYRLNSKNFNDTKSFLLVK